jgi:pimeloyl-ACP methyl ester carboxylesterase
MKFYLTLTKYYLNILAFIAPKYGKKKVVAVFKKVRNTKIKNTEIPFYEKGRPFFVKRSGEDLHCYEFGHPNGKLVFLVHGWNSNAGSLSKFAFELSKIGYRVISFDLPAHANTKEKETDLFECKEAFKNLIKTINPKEPFSIISHSFGSATTAYAISEIDHKVDKLVFLSSNNNLNDVFEHFKGFIGFNNRAYKLFKSFLEEKMTESISDMVISKRVNQSKFNHLLIIHDKFDKVINFKDAKDIHQNVINSTLIPFEKIGHYRMLWNASVVRDTVNFLEN